jgi:hypothetical protein
METKYKKNKGAVVISIVTTSIVGVIIAAKIRINIIANLQFLIREPGDITPNLLKRKKATGISKDKPNPANIQRIKLKYLETEIRGVIKSV